MDSLHPLYKFRYCPVCGSGRFVEHGPLARRCEACGFAFYSNPKGATAAFILNDKGELLCGVRANEPAAGTLDLVGGFIDLDESAEEGLCREIKEETGLMVSPSQLRYLFSRPNRYPFSGTLVRTIDLFFEVHLDANQLPQGSDDITSLRWIPLQAVNPKDFGLASISKAVEKYKETKA